MAKNIKSSKKILGIDPGTNILGYGIVIKHSNAKIEVVTLGVLTLSKYNNHYTKLQKIFERVDSLIKQFEIEEIAIEAPFFGKNVQSMLKLGRAQGVAMAAGLKNNLKIFEYSPRKIKMAVTGNGNASKEQVALMLKSTLALSKLPIELDATDGLATAVCHCYQSKAIEQSSYKSWKDFLNQNPNRKV